MSKEADEYILQLELECYVWVNGDKKNAELVIKKGVLLLFPFFSICINISILTTKLTVLFDGSEF